MVRSTGRKADHVGFNKLKGGVWLSANLVAVPAAEITLTRDPSGINAESAHREGLQSGA